MKNFITLWSPAAILAEGLKADTSVTAMDRVQARYGLSISTSRDPRKRCGLESLRAAIEDGFVS